MTIHNEINNDIRFLAKSEIRLKILSELSNRPDNVRGLVNRTKITYSSVSSNVNKLEENNYIRKVDNIYSVNPMARIYFSTLMDFKKSADLIDEYKCFWGKHNINELSIDCVRNLTDLNNSELIETTPLDIYKTHNTIKKQIAESENIKAIFPYLHPEYPDMIEKVLKNKGSVELITQKNIFKAITQPISSKLKKDSIKKGRLKVYITPNDLNLYLTICDEKMSLGLFKNDGSFDQNRILISSDEKSHRWAENLFSYIKHKVRK